MLYSVIVAIIAIICVLLILVVLLQNGQGQGISGMGGGSSLGGGGGLGARRTADLLSKATSILGGVFLVLCVLANFAIDRQETNRSILQDGVNEPIQVPGQSSPAAVPVQPNENNTQQDQDDN